MDLFFKDRKTCSAFQCNFIILFDLTSVNLPRKIAGEPFSIRVIIIVSFCGLIYNPYLCAETVKRDTDG